MDSKYIYEQLEGNIKVYNDFFENTPGQLIFWRNQPDKWNLLEIICHLYDEEREDFRQRLKCVLEDPEKPLPSIDPQGWVASRNYASRDFKEMSHKFLEERRQSVQYLKSLKNPAWENAFIHPKFGPLTAKLFLSNWLAHDYLHFRQIIKLKFDYLAFQSHETLDYAGKW